MRFCNDCTGFGICPNCCDWESDDHESEDIDGDDVLDRERERFENDCRQIGNVGLMRYERE